MRDHTKHWSRFDTVQAVIHTHTNTHTHTHPRTPSEAWAEGSQIVGPFRACTFVRVIHTQNTHIQRMECTCVNKGCPLSFLNTTHARAHTGKGFIGPLYGVRACCVCVCVCMCVCVGVCAHTAGWNHTRREVCLQMSRYHSQTIHGHTSLKNINSTVTGATLTSPRPHPKIDIE